MHGLYLSLLPGGKIKRHLSTGNGEVLLGETTIEDELIHLSEQNNVHLFQEIKELWAIAEAAKRDSSCIQEYTQAVEAFLCRLKEENMLRYTLLMTMMEDQRREDHGDEQTDPANPYYFPLRFGEAMSADIIVYRILAALSEGDPLKLEEEHYLIDQAKAIVYFHFEEKLTAEYLFRSEEQYYIFLMQNFLGSTPCIAKCRYCGEFFIPKSKHRTLYCDRVIRNGRTCKQIAPYENHKQLAAVNSIVAEFDRVKNLMFRRADRACADKKVSPIDLTYEEYYTWLDKAAVARNRFLTGEISEEEALSIIQAPAPKDTLKTESADYTLD